jgi:hypothetical protein
VPTAQDAGDELLRERLFYVKRLKNRKYYVIIYEAISSILK